jgi:hypothetical protein
MSRKHFAVSQNAFPGVAAKRDFNFATDFPVILNLDF